MSLRRSSRFEEQFWPLWPERPGVIPPGLKRTVVERSKEAPAPDRFVSGVVEPGLWVLRPPRPDGASIVLIPGGGYRGLALDKEGFECALPFVEAGATAFVLEHRLPAEGWDDGAGAPLADARQAVSVIRSRSAALGLDPGRLAVWGASAGGHLAGLLARGPAATKPDLLFLAYPLVTLDGPASHAGCREALLGASAHPDDVGGWSLDQGGWTDPPATWIMHAADDPVIPLEASLILARTLGRAGQTVELHLSGRGGHGFGVRTRPGDPAHGWPDLAIAFGRRCRWLRS